MSYEVVKNEKVYEGKICSVFQDTITLPDGRNAVREVIEHGAAAAIVPIDADGNIIFVRQYRHPARKEVLEIPAGMIEGDERPEVCASRELEEETSYKSDKLKLLTAMYTSIGFCTEILYVYLAVDLEQGNFNFDEDEFIKIEKYPLEKAIEMIFNGEIIDSKTIVGVLAYYTEKNRKK